MFVHGQDSASGEQAAGIARPADMPGKNYVVVCRKSIRRPTGCGAGTLFSERWCLAI
jgi:hypothetical protein